MVKSLSARLIDLTGAQPRTGMTRMYRLEDTPRDVAGSTRHPFDASAKGSGRPPPDALITFSKRK